jgi:hypothetical protein
MTPHDVVLPDGGLGGRDRQELVKEAGRLLAAPARRRLLRDGLTLGGLAMLTG